MLTSYGRGALLSGLLIPETRPLLSGLHVALLLSPPRASDDGTTVQEVAGGGYARVSFGAGGAWWSLLDGGTVVNAVPITWPTALEPWGAVSGWGLMTAPQGGDLVMGGEFGQLVSVQAGSTLVIDSGALSLAVM